MAGNDVAMDPELKDHVYGTIYGNCVGDAIGLLTEFMVKEEIATYYGKKHLEYSMKVPDMHRARWKDGDWTDDSDQMILIMQSVAEHCGKIDVLDFAKRLNKWRKEGIPECEDQGGMGIGATTLKVLSCRSYEEDPHLWAETVWREMGECANMYPAPNGGVMRTSILGIHQFKNLDQVIQNTVAICKTSHHDPRCVASCVAVTTAIAMMLQCVLNKQKIDVQAISMKSYEYACNFLQTDEEKEELRQHMFPKKLVDLKLSGHGLIGYTYKTLGAGFWALNKTTKHANFRYIMEKLVKEGGDADTNSAVAGALVGCRLGYNAIPDSWKTKLVYISYLEENITRFLTNSGWDKATSGDEAATT